MLQESRLRLTSLRIVKGMYVATTEHTTKLIILDKYTKLKIETHSTNNSLQRHNFKTEQCNRQNYCLAVTFTTLNWTTNGNIETDSMGANYDKILTDELKYYEYNNGYILLHLHI